MKLLLKFGSLAAFSVLLSSGTALAGDYNSGIVTKSPSPEYTDVEFGSGWYIRGDIGYNVDGRSGSRQVTIPEIGFSTEADYDDAISLRIGAGYHVAPNVRLEANLESIMDSTFAGLSAATFAASDTGDPGITTTGGTVQTTAEYSISNFMLGANVDLLTLGRFTPYVGGAVGLAVMSYSQTDIQTCTPAIATTSCTNPAGAAGAEVTATTSIDEDTWTHAYQFTVGGAYRMNERTSLDVNYSYTQIGDGDELSYADGTAINPDGVSLHQVRAGVRYELW